MPLLLLPGDSELHVYADGSVYGDVGVGSWAYRIPAFHLRGAGVETGAHIERFELLAAVNAVADATRVDGSMRPIHVHTDSSFVIASLAARNELPRRRSFEEARDLLARVSAALKQRILRCSKSNGESPYHQYCHLDAQREIRGHIQQNGRLARDLAIKREKRKLVQMLKKRIELEDRLKALDQEVAISEASLQALVDFRQYEILRRIA